MTETQTWPLKLSGDEILELYRQYLHAEKLRKKKKAKRKPKKRSH